MRTKDSHSGFSAELWTEVFRVTAREAQLDTKWEMNPGQPVPSGSSSTQHVTIVTHAKITGNTTIITLRGFAML